MARIFVSVLLLVALTSAYVIHPVAGWISLASLFAVLLHRRVKRTTALASATATQGH